MKSEEKYPKILLIDGNALVHRAFHALPPLKSPDNKLVNAVYGFFSIFLAAVQNVNPTHIVAAFDEAGPTFRDELFDGYKAKRVKPPQELYDQIPIIKSTLKALETPVITKKGFEADDIIGALTKKYQSEAKIIILSGDRDIFQLINDGVKVLIPKTGVNSPVEINKEEFFKKYGFAPRLLVDYKALKGDSSDNIPGVAGVGEKTAGKLVRRFGSLGSIYRHLQDIDPKTAAKLKSQRKTAELSRKLAEIKTDIPLNFKLQKAAVAAYDKTRAVDEFRKLGFASLIDRLPNCQKKTAKTVQQKLL